MIRPRIALLGFLALTLGQSLPAQTQSTRVYLRLVSRQAIGPLATYDSLGLSGSNKPNGRGYRLRQSVPAALPARIPRIQGGLALFIADSTADGWLAFYRTPPGNTEPRNARFRVVLYGREGLLLRWGLELNPLLSRPDQLEISDIRYLDGRLYFNESCQSYAREARGRCSALVRVDPLRRRVEWRSAPLVSNGIFLLDGPWVIAGYGFTAETDYLRLLDRSSGRILAEVRLDSAPDYLEMKEGRLWVATSRSLYRFRIGGL